MAEEKTPPKQLPPHVGTATAEVVRDESTIYETIDTGIVHLLLSRSEHISIFDGTLRTVADMTPEAANAVREVARSTYEVPAKEQTKRSWLDLGKHALSCAVGVGGLAAVAHYDPAHLAACVGVVVGALVSVGVVKEIRKKPGTGDQ